MPASSCPALCAVVIGVLLPAAAILAQEALVRSLTSFEASLAELTRETGAAHDAPGAA